VIERTIRTAAHGRYLVDLPGDVNSPDGTLVGFHGYAEGAEAQLARMRAIPGAERWLLVAIQGLHRFYQRRTNEVVASWMTRQDRDLAIADNLDYVSSVVDAVSGEWPGSGPLVFTGFSQGVAMTFRAAAASPRTVDAVVSVGGDVPPELDAAALGRIARVLICRGAADAWYTTAKFDADIGRLRVAGVAVTPLAFDGGHEWSEPVIRAAGAFLEQAWRA
jgi:predicted esterase